MRIDGSLKRAITRLVFIAAAALFLTAVSAIHVSACSGNDVKEARMLRNISDDIMTILINGEYPDLADPSDEGPDIYLELSTPRYEYEVGDPIRFTIEIGLLAPDDGENIVLIDLSDLPDGLRIESGSMNVSGCCPMLMTHKTEDSITWSLSHLEYGQDYTISFTAYASRKLNGSEITAVANAFSVHSQKAASAKTRIYINSPKIEVKKDIIDMPSVFKHGETLDCVITVSNVNSGTTMRDIVVIETMEKGGLIFEPDTISITDENENELVKDRDYLLTTYRIGDEEADGFALEISDDEAEPKCRMLPTDNYGGFLIRMKREHSIMDHTNKLYIRYKMTVEDEDLANYEIRSFVRVPAGRNLYGEHITENEKTPSGGGVYELTI